MQIALATIKDSKDERSWSGTPYYVRQSLEKYFGEPLLLGPMPVLPRRISKAISKGIQRASGNRHHPGNDTTVLAADRWIAQRRLDGMAPPPDAIVVLAASSLVANLRTNIPIIYSCDATPRNMLNYYPAFTNITKKSFDRSDFIERRAIERANILYYPTKWAADSAILHYDADPAKVYVQPYGANIAEVPEAPNSYEPEDDVCRLLMVGVNWNIKGGDIALETLRILQRRGIKTELTVAGCAPAEQKPTPGLNIIPFLNKNSLEDRVRLDELYRRANLFILPSRCECFGIVFCEAAAYGLPSIASRTGGIPELVRHGETGFTIPLCDGAEAYAERVFGLWNERSRYVSMRAAARSLFERRLNWDAWGRELARIIDA